MKRLTPFDFYNEAMITVEFFFFFTLEALQLNRYSRLKQIIMWLIKLVWWFGLFCFFLTNQHFKYLLPPPRKEEGGNLWT